MFNQSDACLQIHLAECDWTVFPCADFVYFEVASMSKICYKYHANQLRYDFSASVALRMALYKSEHYYYYYYYF